MVRIILFILCVLSWAQAESITLMTRAGSKMPTGTAFSARSASGRLYQGILVTQRARNFFRRGTLVFRFDDPVRVVNGSEGVFRASRKMQIAAAGGSTLAAKLADDAVDGSIGAGKARIVGAAAALGVMFFANGGNVELKPGYQLEVEATR